MLRLFAALDGKAGAILHSLPGDEEELFFWKLADQRAESWVKDRVVLLGDAAAAFLPTAGIGASMAMESAAVLADELSRADVAHLDHALAFYESVGFIGDAEIAEVLDVLRSGWLTTGPVAIEFEKQSCVGAPLAFDKDILLLDTLGDLVACYALGDVAFVGGSMVDGGGHNLLEPARYGKPVLFGPHTTNFRALAEEMKQKHAAIEVRDAEGLEREIAQLLEAPAKRREIGERARQLAADDRGVLSASMALARRYLQEDVAG
jgi:glycosyltransferase involved in cell wall biosynthesis